MENKFTFVTISTSFVLGILVIFSSSKIPETKTTYDTTSNIVFKWCVIGAKYPNELNTLNGSFAKDVVSERPVWTRLDLSQEEMDIIYQRIVDIDFFSYPRFFYPTLGDIWGEGRPFSIYYLEYINETGTKIVQWDTKFSAPKDTRYTSLKELGYLIRDLILAKPEYQRLPEPKGGYA